MQLALCAKVDFHTHRILDIELQSDNAQKGRARRKIHQQVQVAALMVEALSRAHLAKLDDRKRRYCLSGSFSCFTAPSPCAGATVIRITRCQPPGHSWTPG